MKYGASEEKVVGLGFQCFDSICSLDILPNYLLEVGVHIFSLCPPGFDFSWTSGLARDEITYSYDTIATAISIFRFYLIFPVLKHISYWTSNRARRVSGMNGVKANAFFAIKAYLKDKPYP